MYRLMARRVIGDWLFPHRSSPSEDRQEPGRHGHRPTLPTSLMPRPLAVAERDLCGRSRADTQRRCHFRMLSLAYLHLADIMCRTYERTRNMPLVISPSYDLPCYGRRTVQSVRAKRTRIYPSPDVATVPRDTEHATDIVRRRQLKKYVHEGLVMPRYRIDVVVQMEYGHRRCSDVTELCEYVTLIITSALPVRRC